MPVVEPNVEDAFNFIVRFLRDTPNVDLYGSSHGYDLYLPRVVCHYLAKVHNLENPLNSRESVVVSSAFYNAAWELARRGVLRPGIANSRGQGTADGSAGNGYSVTESGREWIRESRTFDYVPTEPGRFALKLRSFSPQFGGSFDARAQEAVRCYGANAYLASCAMSGAAAESVMLALAIAKKQGDAAEVEKTYLAAGGRGRIEKLLLGQQPNSIQEEFRGYLSLLKYWRDASAHGHHVGIGENQAFTSLALLLRFALFASDRWKDLTI